MAPNSLFPAYVQMGYHSAYGSHLMTLPTLHFDSGSGDFDTWSSGAVNAVTMIDDLVDLFLPFFPDTVFFDTWRVFTKADADSDPHLEVAGTFTGKQGTDSSPGWTKAVQGTLSYLGTGGTKGRLVFLDSTSDNDFSPLFTLPGSGDLFDLMTELNNSGKGWSTRGNERPATFLQYSKTLNEKLRREYRMF